MGDDLSDVCPVSGNHNRRDGFYDFNVMVAAESDDGSRCCGRCFAASSCGKVTSKQQRVYTGIANLWRARAGPNYTLLCEGSAKRGIFRETYARMKKVKVEAESSELQLESS